MKYNMHKHKHVDITYEVQHAQTQMCGHNVWSTTYTNTYTRMTVAFVVQGYLRLIERKAAIVVSQNIDFDDVFYLWVEQKEVLSSGST